MIYCCRCRRPINKSAVPATLGSTNERSYGPVCAMRLGLLAAADLLKPKRRKANRKPRQRTNSNQMTLIA